MKRLFVSLVTFVLALVLPLSSLSASAVPYSSFNSKSWKLYDNGTGGLIANGTSQNVYLTRNFDSSSVYELVYTFDFPSDQTDTVVTFALDGVYFDDTYSVGYWEIVNMSASLWQAGLPVEQLNISTSGEYADARAIFQVDCSTIQDATVTVKFFLRNHQVADSSRLNLEVMIQKLDNAKPNGWFNRIWRAIKDGFSSVGSWISAQTSAISGKFDELISKLTNSEGKADAEAQAQSQAQQQQDLQNGVDEINSAEKPDLSNMDLSQFTNVTANPVLTNIMTVPQVLQMMLASATLAIFSYLLFGKKG